MQLGQLKQAPDAVTRPWNSVKVFSATMAEQRAQLGERVTEWLSDMRQRGGELADTVVAQSSDHEFHCLSITVFYNMPITAPKAIPARK